MLGQHILVYDRISANRRETWLLMLLFVAFTGGFAVLIGYVLGLPPAVAPLLLVPFALYAVFSYYAAASTVLSMSDAHEVTKEQEPDFYRAVENLCIGSGLPMPRLYVIEDGAPNAFATGRDPKHAAVAATRGLLQKLDYRELQAVLAHEMSHVGNYDIRLMTIVVVLVGLVALLADFFLRWTWFGSGARSKNSDRGGGGAYLILLAVALLMALLAPLAAQLIRLAISRQREYLADSSGALLVRDPDALADALEKISRDPDPLEEANKATAHLYIVNPLREHASFLNDLFSTHPPVEERIRILRAMA